MTWVDPAATGPRITTFDQTFPGPNDGPHGVTVDDAFITANAGASWLSFEGGVPVISGCEILERALNCDTRVIIRDCRISSPTRDQPTWGNLGDTDDAPVVLLDADESIIEYCEIWGSGDDGARTVNGATIPADGTGIASRGVRFEGSDCIARFNDISFVRGAVQGFTNCLFEKNYCHDFTYGLDPNRAGGSGGANPDETTHNNAANNSGYIGFRVIENYIDARYGRVSTHAPSDSPTPLNPFAWGFYHGPTGREVQVGDGINGFTFTNYLNTVGRDGDGYEAVGNYTIGSFRPFRCNGSSNQTTPTAAANISENVFDLHNLASAENNNITFFDDQDDSTNITFNGSCNVRIDNGVATVMPSTVFGPLHTHGTTGCDIAAITAGPSTVAYEITSPLGVDVASPQTVSGTAGGSFTLYEYRMENTTDGTVWDGTSYVPDDPATAETDHWHPATFDPITETWVADSATTLPQNAQTMTIRARRH